MTPTIWNDAGLLREYVLERAFGGTLIYGGNYLRTRMIWRVLKRISKLASISLERVLTDTIDDYNAANDH